MASVLFPDDRVILGARGEDDILDEMYQKTVAPLVFGIPDPTGERDIIYNDLIEEKEEKEENEKKEGDIEGARDRERRKKERRPRALPAPTASAKKLTHGPEVPSTTVIHIDIDPALDRSKYLEALTIRKNYFYSDNMRALTIVKAFIKRKERIIYGGTAVDFALRAKGSHLYPDEFMNFPDLDFYSPESVEDAYELADELFDAGIENVSAIVAYHTQTMRVRFNMISVADLSYMPPRVYSKVKYIDFDGYRVVHPHHQFIDMHIGMAFPFRNSPREVILDRKNKDYERFNMLYKHYPVQRPDNVSLVKMSVKAGAKIPDTAMLIGIGAYPIYYKMAQDIGVNVSDFPCATLTADDILELDWYPPTPQITFFVEADELDKPNHESWMDAFPPSTNTPDTIKYHAEHERYHVSEYESRIVASVQYSLAHLMYQYEETENPAYLIYYHALLHMTNAVIEKIGDNIEDSIVSPFGIPLQFWPSAETRSISSALDISLKSCLVAIDQYKGEPIIKPHAFYPDVNSRPPQRFNYGSSRYFQIAGSSL